MVEIDVRMEDQDEAEGISVDVSHQFHTSEVFDSRELLIDWCKIQGRKLNTIVVIVKSEKYIAGRNPRLHLGCERGGVFRSHHSLKDDCARRNKRRQTSASRKCNCPFLVKGVFVGNDRWTVQLVNGTHNHCLPHSSVGHLYAGRLLNEEKQILSDMTIAGVYTREILTTSENRNVNNASMIDLCVTPMKKTISGFHLLAHLPEFVDNFIDSIVDVPGDGNCGFRCVADQVDELNGCWKDCRKNLLAELGANWDLYVRHFGTQMCNELKINLDHYESPCGVENWMCMSETGYLIANAFNSVVVFLSKRQSLTFFPHERGPIVGQNHKFITFAHIQNCHYVKVKLLDNAPIPPTANFWIRFANAEAMNWINIFKERQENFLALKPDDMATRDIPIDV